ncbi:MAG TPA: hypothetical protein VG101_14950 [Puia sp.]|jgi:hypothetical protein|nr:hypothetical protein [Puia sp.]
MTFGILLNFLLPVFLIISIALLVYALITFIRSRNEHSPSLLRKSFKIAILPFLYILGVVVPIILIDRNNVRKSAQLAADAVGIYQYNTTDSLLINATLKSDKTFYLQDGPAIYTGKWEIYKFSQVITLQDKNQSQPFAATLRLTSGKVTALVLSTVKDSIVLTKTD